MDKRSDVLVVDNDRFVLTFTARRLQMDGFAPLPATNALEALEAVRRVGGVRVALLDVDMPDTDGPTLMALLRAEFPSVRVCFMTGGTSRAADLISLGAECLLCKPFAAGEPARTIRELMARLDRN